MSGCYKEETNMGDMTNIGRMKKQDQQFILRQMLALARYLVARQIPAPQVREAVKRLRDDLSQMRRGGIPDITVDRESYLDLVTDQQKGEVR